MGNKKKMARKSTGGKVPRKQLGTKSVRKFAPLLIRKSNWTSIHVGFTEKSHCSYSLENKTYRQEWEERGFTYEETKLWIRSGWKPDDIYFANEWKNRDFALHEVLGWIKTGLKSDEFDLAYYLKKQSYQPTTVNDLEVLKKNFKNWLFNIRKSAQRWLDYFFPRERRNQITHLDISKNELEGSLNLNDFINLEVFDCFDNKIISLDSSNCEEFSYLNCGKNQLIALLLPKRGRELKFLNLANNKLEENLMIFTHLENLEELWIGNNNFSSSLITLQNLIELRNLDIEKNSNINDDLEYLPKGLKKIWCDGCGKLEERLKLYSKKDKTDYGDGKIYTYYDYQEWRKNSEEKNFKQLEKLISNLKPDLDSKELVKKLKPFNVSNITSYNNLQELFSLLDNKINSQLIQRIGKLISLIKQQKQKIIEAYLHFAPEKELLRELITIHLAYNRVNMTKEENDEETIKLWKQKKEVQRVLENKFEEEPSLLIKIENILMECNKLSETELEIEKQSERKIAIEYDQQTFDVINININGTIVNVQGNNHIVQQTDNETTSNLKRKFSQSEMPIKIKGIEVATSTTKKPILEYLIGKGGYGEVYRGKWGLQDVAVKKLYCLAFHNNSNENIKEIMNEVNILKNLRNRYVIQYYGIYSDNQDFLIIMDYAENGTLAQFININKDKDHDWNFNIDIIKQIVLGLDYIHQKKIIHRDLKSSNILLANDYQVKISDFGLSKTKNVSISLSKNVVGTLEWIAPEVLRGEKHSEKSDIYSLGMVVWEITAKCTEPFKNIDNDYDLILHISKNKKEKIPNNSSENIRNVIEQCWRDNPNERTTLVNILKIIGELPKNQGENYLAESSSINTDKNYVIDWDRNQEQEKFRAQIQILPKQN